VQVDWGDGSAPEIGTPGRKPFHRSHHYTAPGTYTVSVIWTDTRTGASNFRDLRLTVSTVTEVEFGSIGDGPPWSPAFPGLTHFSAGAARDRRARCTGPYHSKTVPFP
jgi:hypothetical protein